MKVHLEDIIDRYHCNKITVAGVVRLCGAVY